MRLIEPEVKFYPSYLGAIEENRRERVKEDVFLGGTQLEFFRRIEEFATGRNLPLHYVKATYLWLTEGEDFIGEISIRHKLTDALLRFGGNIGYGVRYSRWNRGYGTAMLRGALEYAGRELGLKRVLITCDDDNYGSARVIEKNGGVLADKIQNVIDGAERTTRRYWIDLEDRAWQ